ncbi:MAG: small ribosomal subunit Rsm22 family protein [Spirochaetes bacterium]|nr:small ribosomal subunit Rsm22 family protein [Spirochaetota bacterium]
MPSFEILPQETRKTFFSACALIRENFPIPGRFLRALPSQTAELSRLLTNNRGERPLSYLTRPNFLSAYMHYFLPWNIYRLCLLLHSIDLNLSSGDSITDLGSGPLTFTSALWIARADLRNIPLEINCIDRSAPALKAGSKFFNALCASANMGNIWKINLIRDNIDIRRVARKGNKSALVCAVNLFNEIYESLPHSDTEGLKHTADNAAQLMSDMALKDGSILTVEPGVPQSGRFISFLRTAFLETDMQPLSPCTHSSVCPFSGNKKRWCHFAYETFDAPKELQQLSAAAALPKERLVFSYLLTSATAKINTKNKLRVISDSFPLPQNRFGRYGCCSKGLVLLAGERKHIEKIFCGSLIPMTADFKGRDEKSGAPIMEVI